MNKIITNVKNLSLFQKIQIISGFIPLYSFAFVFITSYIVCWKNKKTFGALLIISVIYFSILCLTWNSNIYPIIKYIACCIISLIGNYFLVCSQTKSKA